MHSWHSFIHFDALIRIFSIQLSEKELRKKRLSVRYCRHVCCCVMLWLPGFVDIILSFFIILVTIVSFRGEGQGSQVKKHAKFSEYMIYDWNVLRKTKEVFQSKMAKRKWKNVIHCKSKETISGLKKWQRCARRLGFRKASYTLFIYKKHLIQIY